MPDVASCYETLGIIHEHYKPIPGLIKDYISDCLKRKDEKGLSNLVDKMPRSYFGKLYIYQAMGEIKEKSKLKTTKQTP